MTGVLLVAVVLIWGVIILKVVKGSRPAEKPLVENRIKEPVKNASKDSLQFLYHFSLILSFQHLEYKQIEDFTNVPEKGNLFGSLLVCIHFFV